MWVVKHKLNISLNVTPEVEVIDNQTIKVKMVVPVRGRILWIIPITVNVEAEGVIKDGTKIIMIKRPWWWFLVTVVDRVISS